MDDDAPATAGPSPLRRVAAGLIAVEAVALIGAGAVLVVRSLAGDSSSGLGSALFIAVLGLAVGAGLGAAAWNVLSGERWTRGPVITWQLLQAGVAMPVSRSEAWYVGVPMLIIAIAVGVLMLNAKVIPHPED